MIVLDLIIKNAKIITMDENFPQAEAVAVHEGKIIKVGRFEDLETLIDIETKIIDIKGNVLVPGFNDSHMHLLSYGFSIKRVKLAHVKSLNEIIKRMRDHICNNKIEKGSWVEGIGWNQDYFDNKIFPTRYDLDKISLEYPICIIRACYHVAIVNSKALELIGIMRSSPQVVGGQFDIDENGEPLGIFRENALRLIYDKVPEPNISDIKVVIYNAITNALQKGITSIQSDDFEHLPSKDYEKLIRAYKELAAEGKLRVRINEQCLLPNISSLKSFISKGYTTGVGNNFFKIGPLKLIADGSLGARTALLSTPYDDEGNTSGISIYEQEDLNELIITAHNKDMQIAIHCIGDKAMEMAFEGFEKAQKLNHKENCRHSIIHCQITNEVLLNKFKKLDIIAHIQPIFLDYDLHIVEDRIGVIRAKTSYNWKTMIDKGVKIACGSDCPVEEFDVLPNIYCAVTRKDLSGYPETGWLPQQKLSVYEALRGFTMGGAFASFEENIKGSITSGKLADMVVLSEDIFNIESEKIKDVKIFMTFVHGKLMYKNEKFILD